MNKRKNAHTVYKIFGEGDMLLYIGRTNQPLQSRIRGHVFAKPMHRILNIDMITRIEYAEFEREADMNLYEIYFILTLKPPFNVDDKTRDYPTVTLPDVEWRTFTTPLWEKWIGQIHDERELRENLSRRQREIYQERGILRRRYHDEEITRDEAECVLNALRDEEKEIEKKLRGVTW